MTPASNETIKTARNSYYRFGIFTTLKGLTFNDETNNLFATIFQNCAQKRQNATPKSVLTRRRLKSVSKRKRPPVDLRNYTLLCTSLYVVINMVNRCFNHYGWNFKCKQIVLSIFINFLKTINPFLPFSNKNWFDQILHSVSLLIIFLNCAVQNV